MPDFNELVKNLYTSKNRELTPEKLDYITKNYSGKEEDFVKNFYATIKEDLTPDKLSYIKDTYLKKKDDLQSDSTSGSEPLPIGLDRFRTQVPTGEPSVLTPKGKSDYQEQVKDFKPEVQKPISKPKTLSEAVSKDDSYVGAIWNQIPNSVSDFVGGLSKLVGKGAAQMYGKPVELLFDVVNKTGGKNIVNPIKELATYENIESVAKLGEKAVKKLRTSASSEEYERSIQEGFNVTDGVGFQDVKAIPVMLARLVADAGLSIPTAGLSFVAQGYNQGLNEYDEAVKDMPKDLRSDNAREGFGVMYGTINGLADKLGLDFITKSKPVSETVKKYILKEAVKELAKKEAKDITSNVIENTISNIAKSTFNKVKAVGVKTVIGAAGEGVTEPIQGGLSDGLKILTNKLSGSNVFDVNEIKENFWKSRINDAAGGFVLGGALGGAINSLKSTDSYIAERVAESTTPEQIQLLKEELVNSVDDNGNPLLDEEKINILNSAIDKYSEANQKLPAGLSTEKRAKALQLISERDEIKASRESAIQNINNSDEAIKPEMEGDLVLFDNKEQQKNDEIREAVTGKNYKYFQDEDGKFYKKLGDGKAEEISQEYFNLQNQDTEIGDQLTKKETDAVQVETTGQVPVQPEAPVGEEVEQGKPQAKPKVVGEEGVKAEEVGGNVGEDLKITGDVGIDKSNIPLDKTSQPVNLGSILATNGDKLDISAEEINLSYPGKKKYVRKITATKGDEKAIISFWENNNKLIILYVESTKKGAGYGTDLINKVIKEAKDAGIEEIVADNVESLSSEKYWEKQGFIQDPNSRSNRILPLSTAQEQTPAQEVEKLRAEEQAELKAAIPNADQYLTDGKVDGKKLTDPKDKKAFKKIYDKYNILITPPLKEAKADAVITPDNSSNYANMTEDNKGNFVFFHVGNKGYKTIKTGTGGSIVTSREESAALSKVGGLAMYYTGPEQIERQSASGARYAVKVPKEKVYDFNTDKLNFIEEAEARHDAENPGKAFDLNSQLAYVTKIAGENGFDMVVAQWKDMTRAQTTKELTPVDVQESGGSSFSEKYEDNRKKGFESVIPVSKSKKLADVYNDIHKIRNKEKRYDDLYRLYAESDKLSQDEITKLISESDLPQEIKDKYNEALEFKQESRRSQQTKSKEEVVVSGVNYTVPTLEEQSLLKEQRTEKSYFDAKVDELPSSQLTSEQVDDILSNGNFGILTGQNPMGNPVPDSVNNKLNKKAKEWLKDKGYEFFEVAGKYGQTEGSLLVPGLSIDDALAFAKEFNQDSVITNDGLIYQDGSMNQRVKEDDSFTVDVSDPKTDFASAIKLSDGSVKGFKIGLNLDEKVPFKQESEQSIDIDKISSNTGIKAKNLRDLYNINRKIFSQDRIKSLASAIVMDRMIGAMAKRAGVSKGQIYNRIYFKKATSGEIKSLDNNSSVLFQANYSDDKTGITFSYDKNTDKFNNLKKEGYITDDKNINDFSGQYIVFHKPDYAFSGDILKNGKIIVEGQGGIYYPIKFHEDGLVWAASSERAASAFANRLNESARLSPDGKVRLALVSSPNEKVLSSYNAASGIVDVLSSKVFDEKFGLNEAIIKSALIESANSELGTNITNDKSLKEVVSIIKQKIKPENIGSIDKRKNFIYFGKNNLLAKIAENIKDTKNIEDLVSFFGDGIANKDFVGKRTGKLSRANLVQAFSYMFNEPMLRDVKDSDLTYAVIEVPASKDGGDVVTYEKNESHKSYPYSIIIKDKSAKTTLNILSETSKWNESAIDPLTNKTVAKDRMLNLLDTLSGVSNKPLMISKPKQVDINWEVSKEGKGDPSISSRNPIVEEAAKKLKEGKITNEEYRATVSENSPIGPITRFFAPATENQIKSAISEDKLEKVNLPIEDGIEVALRLDIPAYKNNNTWVVSVHEGTTDSGPPISYTNVGKITNVKFGFKPKGALAIAAGIQKTTIGRMFGKWENIPGDTLEQKGENAKNILGDIVNNPSWVQVGMNPFRHSYFYDRNSDIGRPILAAEEVVQIGGLVYAKNPQYGNWTDEAFAVRDSFDSAGNEIRFQDKMGAIITQDSNAIIYALTDPNVSTPLHEMAHAFEHYLTLDERKDVLGWANTNTWTKETSEKFARGFEKYLSEGKAPTPLLQKIFNKFKEWLTDIYNGIVDSEIDIELNEKMRSIYSSMLGEDKVVTKLNESNVENAIELLDEIEDNKRKAERASSKRKVNLEQKISEAETELDKIPDETKIVRVINDNFDKIKKDLKEQGLLNVKC